MTFSELIVDEYFIEICRASKTDEVDFQEDGGWKEYYTPKEREKLEQRERSVNPTSDFGESEYPEYAYEFEYF